MSGGRLSAGLEDACRHVWGRLPACLGASPRNPRGAAETAQPDSRAEMMCWRLPVVVSGGCLSTCWRTLVGLPEKTPVGMTKGWLRPVWRMHAGMSGGCLSACLGDACRLVRRTPVGLSERRP